VSHKIVYLVTSSLHDWIATLKICLVKDNTYSYDTEKHHDIDILQCSFWFETCSIPMLCWLIHVP